VRQLIVLSAATLFLAGCSAPGGVIPIGNDFYMIAKDGSFTTFNGSTVKAELYHEANDFCQKQNRRLQPINSSARDSGYARYANAELQFRCLAQTEAAETQMPALIPEQPSQASTDPLPAAPLPSLQTEHHVALVIGNSDYKEAPLRNPLNDARDMTKTLRELGFEVIEVTNSNKQNILNAVNEFSVRLQQASIGLFYYSGHGVQFQGTNYLVPLQATIGAPADLEQETVDARKILGRMEQSQTALNIVILDACRNNPFRNLFGFRSFGERGLAPLPRVRSSLIAYATQPDNVAEDGIGRNGTYTKYLLQYIKQSGLSLPDLFSEVGRAVLQETNGKQEPWVSFSPLPRFCFAGCTSLN